MLKEVCAWHCSAYDHRVQLAKTLPVDARAIPDGDGMTVYVRTDEPRESSCVPIKVQLAVIQRSKALAERNYEQAETLHKEIINAGYRIINLPNNEAVLARKYRIRLRGIDAPESSMPYGQEARDELVKIIQGKCLRLKVYCKDRYGRFVADIYCDGVFVQESLLKRGCAWHYSAYDHRVELAKWEKEARAKRVGLWAASNPEEPWEWRKDRREGRMTLPSKKLKVNSFSASNPCRADKLKTVNIHIQDLEQLQRRETLQH